jgi:hypothetical protein
MPQVSVNDIIDKTLYPRFNLNYYRVSEINDKGDFARPAGQLKAAQPFVVDSYITPTAGYTKYGITYAKRSYLYLLFEGAGRELYGVKWNPNAFSLSKLQAQGVKTTEQKIEEQKEKDKSFTDKLADVFGSAGGVVKNILYIGLGVWAIGYLIPKIRK